MGLIGFFITVVILVAGAGYYFFGMSSSSLTIENEAPAPVVEKLGLYEELKAEVDDLKHAEEERVEQEIADLEEDLATKKIAQEAPVIQPEGAQEVKAASEAAITDRLMDAGFATPKKARTIDTIVLHSSYNPNGGDAYDVEKMVAIYESYGVSAHYLIDRKGKIYRLVADKNIAYHAGASKMPDGRKNVNDFSLGIEMLNKEETEYTAAQYEAVNALIAFLKKNYSIKSIVGHGDIAPDRKTDPWNFDWKKLH